MGFEELRAAVDEVELVDAHAHNIVAIDSTFPFINSLSEATGDALSFAPYSLSFKVSIYLSMIVCHGFLAAGLC